MNAWLEPITRTYGTLSGWQWLVLLAIPPLIMLLYFLKLRRQPVAVPSTYLWRKAIEDLHVNSLWQRLRQNLLLFLQLLTVGLAILACLRPSWEGSQLVDSRYVFLIDTSASMSATDIAPTRLEAVKRQLVELIDKQLRPGSVAMVVSFSDRPLVEQPFTDNRNQLKRRIEAIQPTQRTSDLEGALRFAAGLANPGRTATDETDVAAAAAMPATLMIYSDGQFQRAPQFAMGNLRPQYLPIGSSEAENVAITAFSGRTPPDRPETLQVFGQVQNFGSQPVTLTANLESQRPERELLDATELSIPPGETRGVEFTMGAMESGELRLTLQHTDALPLDNVAYLAINPRRPSRVLLVTPGNDAIRAVLETPFGRELAEATIEGPSFLQTPEYERQAADGAYDLMIYDRCEPAKMPRSHTFFLGAMPPDSRWRAGEPQELPQVLDTDRLHPLMRYVELGDLTGIVSARMLTAPGGGTELIESHLGTLLAIAPRDGFEDLVSGFALTGEDASGNRYSNTDWPIRVSFPVFIGNVLAYLGGTRDEATAKSPQPGEPMVLRANSQASKLLVTAPSGATAEVTRGVRNQFLYGGTDRVGVYTVREGADGEPSARFAVNLFDATESNIRPASSIATQYEDLAAQPAWEPRRHEAWKYLVALALVVLLLEWYIYNRRVYV
jgi:hypothetical protein